MTKTIFAITLLAGASALWQNGSIPRALPPHSVAREEVEGVIMDGRFLPFLNAAAERFQAFRFESGASTKPSDYIVSVYEAWRW